MNNYESINDAIVIQCDAKDEKSSGGIILVDQIKQTCVEGIVVSVGSGTYDSKGVHVPNRTKVGDRVLFSDISCRLIDESRRVVTVKDCEIVARVIDGEVVPFEDKVVVSDIQRGERTVGGIILTSDIGKVHGIRAKWAMVHAVGDEVRGIKKNQYVLVQYGRWTPKIKVGGTDLVIWGVDYPNGILLVSDEPQEDLVINDTFDYSYKKEVQ